MPRKPKIPLLIVVALIGSTSFSSSSALKQTTETQVPRIVLSPQVAQCILDKKPWSECYNMQRSVVGNAEPRVGEGFRGFHEKIYKKDSGIRSIWVPTPAESAIRYHVGRS